jgi:hypothetical protein
MEKRITFVGLDAHKVSIKVTMLLALDPAQAGRSGQDRSARRTKAGDKLRSSEVDRTSSASTPCSTASSHYEDAPILEAFASRWRTAIEIHCPRRHWGGRRLGPRTCW